MAFGPGIKGPPRRRIAALNSATIKIGPVALYRADNYTTSIFKTPLGQQAPKS